MHRKLILPALALLVGCTGQPEEEMDRPEERHIHSRVGRGAEGEVVLGSAFSGGGAGDTTYRVLACTPGKLRCEILASISWDQEETPELVADGAKIYLVVNEGSRIGLFRNFSRTIPSLNLGGLFLRYRQPYSPKGSASPPAA